MWQSLDVNGNGIVSLAEVDRWVVNAFPLLDHKPALMRAFKTATLKEGDGDDWVERHEFVTVRPALREFFFSLCGTHPFVFVDSWCSRRACRPANHPLSQKPFLLSNI
jgi:hypothetical protein